jgi:hypothetical protein
MQLLGMLSFENVHECIEIMRFCWGDERCKKAGPEEKFIVEKSCAAQAGARCGDAARAGGGGAADLCAGWI